MKRIDWNTLSEAERDAALARPAQSRAEELRIGVERIIAEVRANGDTALRELSARYDRCALDAIEVTEAEFKAAEAKLAPELKAAISEAAERIETFHRAAAPQPVGINTAVGVRVERVLRPIQRVGLYVPAGSAPLPSTALMLGVPARIAGCREVVLCSPARADGTCDEAVLFTARLVGVHRVFKLGGAQAIAAMAYGTESVPRCDKLFGPGNAWVTEAKLQVSSDPNGAAIDMPAGPSEVLVIADAQANPVFVAADLLSQAEHGPDSQVVLVTDSAALLDKVAAEVDRQCAQLPRGAIAEQALRTKPSYRGDVAGAGSGSEQPLRTGAFDSAGQRRARTGGQHRERRLHLRRRVDARIGRRLLQRQQSRVANLWLCAQLQRRVGGQLSEADHGAGTGPQRPARHRSMHRHPGRGRTT